MKKAKLATVKKDPVHDQAELRRWCIENAIRWPVETDYRNAGVYSAGGGGPPHRYEADVIGRAEKLFAWVTKPL